MSREILVRGPNWLGDLVMSTPAFRALRAAFPEDRLSLQLREGLVPLLDGSPWFDRVLPIRSDLGGPWHARARALASEARALRRIARFDLGICLPDSWSSALLMRAAGVRRIVGYARAGRGVLLHHPVPRLRGKGPEGWVARERHAVALAEAAGAPARGTALELHTTPAEEDEADRLLGPLGLEAGGFIALAPGASYGPSKCWPAGSFAMLADDLQSRGLPVCLLGAPGEEAISAEVMACMRSRAADLTGRLPLGSMKAVLRRARALVCNDAGARHVAVAFGVPSVVLLGPTSLEKTDCNLERVRIVETDVACRPCYERVCPIDHRCMTRIPPTEVRDALLGSLGAPAGEVSERGRRRAENAGT